MIRSSREAASAGWPSAEQTAVDSLGPCRVTSPLRIRSDLFVDDENRAESGLDALELNREKGS